jgi:hypothetical protein
MTVTQDDALSLLNKYAEERTPVLAVFGTSSLSIARVTGTIRVSSVAGALVLIVGEDDTESDQIKFRLSADCKFEYGDFRGEEPYSQKWNGFLVVGSSKGDTLSLFEARR